MKLKLSGEALDKLRLENSTNLLSVNKKILMGSTVSDAVIIPSNGANLKCHKAFLAGSQNQII